MTSRRPSRGRALPKTALALSAALLGLLGTGLAHAEGDAPAPDAAHTKAIRRSDFTIGAGGGLGFGRASGYPNKVQQIGDPAYKSSTKLALGSGQLIWLGVAFNDYLTFGLGFGGFKLSGNDRDASASVFGFHVDAFPLFDVDKNLQDLGVFTNFGTGPLKIKGGPDEADGGLMSYLEAGVVYERLRLWRIGMGPSVSLIHVWSESASATTALVGARLAFYGGP
ncbi:MAG TPA: hypothetical protein VNG33_17175 [Polyangiaceae bacterium]|nr:hypothetical protein [Polyangiaceae bacterium]